MSEYVESNYVDVGYVDGDNGEVDCNITDRRKYAKKGYWNVGYVKNEKFY